MDLSRFSAGRERSGFASGWTSLLSWFQYAFVVLFNSDRRVPLWRSWMIVNLSEAGVIWPGGEGKGTPNLHRVRRRNPAIEHHSFCRTLRLPLRSVLFDSSPYANACCTGFLVLLPQLES